MRRAQSVFEYVFMVAVVVGALISMQLYVKRAVQGRLKEMAKEIGPQAYVPGVNTYSNFTVEKNYTTIEISGGAHAVTYMGYIVNGTMQGEPEVTRRQGYETSCEDDSCLPTQGNQTP